MKIKVFAMSQMICHLHTDCLYMYVPFQTFCQRYVEIENTLAHYDPSTGTSKRTGKTV